MNKIILIPDSFKGTMDSKQICSIMEEAVHAVYPRAEIVSIPVADGGEGSVDCFLTALGGQKIEMMTMNPFMEPVSSFYGLLADGKTAVIEMASCAGLPLVEHRKNPMKTTTYGVGRQIVDAAMRGAKKIIVGLGGSSTNDGGCGAACAAGVRFFDREGNSFVPTGGTLKDIVRIDISERNPILLGVEIITMCDIDNPMFGRSGAAAVFGPQKGATPAMVELLDEGVRRLAECIRQDLSLDLSQVPGTGAAGAMGAGMVAFFGSKLQMGIDAVLDTICFETVLQGADMVLTGEGKLDSQSLRGKVVVGVARRAKPFGIPVAAVVGDIEDPVSDVYGEGVSGIYSINRTARNFLEIRHMSPAYLRSTVENLMFFCQALDKRPDRNCQMQRS